MKIPIQVSFKLFNETYSVKKNVEDLHISEVVDMYKSVLIPLFGQDNYERAILSIADNIRDKMKPEVVKIIKPEPKGVLAWVDDLFD
jgi:hypothetical protein